MAVDVSLESFARSTYEYGSDPETVGVAGAVIKLMENIPYGLIADHRRQANILDVNSDKFKGLAKSYRSVLSSEASDVQMVGVLLFSYEDSSSNPHVTNITMRGGLSIALTQGYFWEEDGKFFEFHISFATSPVENTTCVFDFDVREGITSNILVCSLPPVYDFRVNMDTFIPPIKYNNIILENVRLPSYYINLRQHWYSRIVGLSWQDALHVLWKEDLTILMYPPEGIILPLGEEITWTLTDPGHEEIYSFTANTDAYVWQINAEEMRNRVLNTRSNVPYVVRVNYETTGGLSGIGQIVIYKTIKSNTYPESRLLDTDDAYLDNYTINAMIDSSRKVDGRHLLMGRDIPLRHVEDAAMVNEVWNNDWYVDRFFPTLHMTTGLNSNFTFENVPEISPGVSFGGLTKYKWFLKEI